MTKNPQDAAIPSSSATAADTAGGVVELLRALVRFDTSNPPGNERACLEYVAGVLRTGGIESSFLSRDRDRPNLVARLPGQGSRPPLLLFGHVDVVPANPREWRRPPFGGDVAEGLVWGRGTLDMKSGVAMLVTALLRAATRAVPPAGDVILALTSDEEAGSALGARFLVEEHADLFAGVRHAISEFGGFSQWIGNRRFYPIQVAEKQRCRIRATIRGPGGHPSAPPRGTAAYRSGELLRRLERRRLPVHVTPLVRDGFATLAPALSLHERVAFRLALVPALTRATLRVAGSKAARLEALVRNTATPTIMRGGDSANVVPTEVVVELDGRLLPGYSPEDLIHELEAVAGPLASYEVLDEEPAVPQTPDLALFPMLSQIIKERDPTGTPFPMLLPGYTDARYFARLGIQTYGFLPLKLPKDFPLDLIHATDERVPVDALDFGVDCLCDVIRRYGSDSASTV